MPVSLEGLLLILTVAFGPPALFALSVARAKRYRREPGHTVLFAFLWGAIPAAVLALVVNTFAMGGIVRPYLREETLTQLVVAVVVAPFVEETIKPAIIRIGQVRKHTDERVDGLIYGAVAGLGFSATENLFYEVAALAEAGQAGYIVTAVLRTFSSTMLHATATAITGYGIARQLTGGSSFVVLPFYLMAVLLHAAFNFVASFALAYTVLGLVVVSVWGFLGVRSRIHRLSLIAPHHHWDPVGPGHAVHHHPHDPGPHAHRPPDTHGPPGWRVLPDPDEEGPRAWDPHRRHP